MLTTPDQPQVNDESKFEKTLSSPSSLKETAYCSECGEAKVVEHHGRYWCPDCASFVTAVKTKIRKVTNENVTPSIGGWHPFDPQRQCKETENRLRRLWEFKARIMVEDGKIAHDVLETPFKQDEQIPKVRSEPATEKQKRKLRYFGYAFDENISKGQASDVLDKCAKNFPEINRAYYNRPATKEQLAKLRRPRNKTLKYGQAKDLIWERDMDKRHQDQVTEMEKMDYEFTILGFLRWREDRYEHLTYSRVKKAARALDKINPAWTKSRNCEDLLLQKVTELFPEFAAKEGWS